MKRSAIILIFSIILIPLNAINTNLRRGDKCNSDALLKEVHAKFQDFTLLKDYLIYLKAKKKDELSPTMAFPISLTSGLKYKFAGVESDGYPGKLIMNIYSYENSTKEFLEATNIQKGTNKHYNSIEFICHASGSYLIEFTFNGDEGCGVAASGFTLDK
jgi:hypothetical protein